MKIPFYTNPDVLERNWGTKYDFWVFLVFVLALVGANLAFLGITSEKASIFLRIGISGAYVGVVLGVFMHLAQQIKKGDEFASKIISSAIAHAGLTTILFVALMTVIHGVRGLSNLAMWNLVSPVFFLFIAYVTARQLARRYASS